MPVAAVLEELATTVLDLDELATTTLETELLLEEELLEDGATLEAAVSQAPRSVQAFVHAQPTPGSYGPPILHQPPTVH